MSTSLPVYGQYTFEALPKLVQDLKAISTRYLQEAAFSVFLVLQDQRKLYGLTLEELSHQYPDWEGHLHSITFVAGSQKGEVVRVSVQFFPPPTAHMVRFVIASGNARTNYAIRGILTGEAMPTIRSTSVRLPITEILAPAIRLRADALLLPRGRAYNRPTLHLHDHFYFNRDTAADTLVDLLNLLSERFLQKTPFHLRLETLDGDFHLHLDRRELRYLYERHGSKLLMVYIDALTPDDQWMSLRLSYHPLSSGPNAEVSLLSEQADELLDNLHHHLSIPPPVSPLPVGRYEAFHMPLWPESMSHIGGVLEEISRQFLDRTPPVAYILMQDGSQQTGLSLYQLQQRFGGCMHLLKTVVFTFGRVSTGQISLLWMEKTAEESCQLYLSSMWGFEEVQQAVSKYWQAHTPECSRVDEQKPPIPPISSLAIWAPSPGLQKNLSAYWASVAEDAEIPHSVFETSTTHQIWEDLIQCMQTHEGLLIDMSFKQPHAIFAAQLMQLMSKPVFLALQKGRSLPEELVDCPLLVYTNEQADTQGLSSALKKLCKR